jgi:hypothetical protein
MARRGILDDEPGLGLLDQGRRQRRQPLGQPGSQRGGLGHAQW